MWFSSATATRLPEVVPGLSPSSKQEFLHNIQQKERVRCVLLLALECSVIEWKFKMPLFRGITLSIHTPFAIDGLQETPLPPLNVACITEEDNKFASVFVPAHPQSLFWLSYAVEPPVDETFLVFKLFINRQHVVTWKCDEDDDWRGKVQFALFRKSNDDGIQGGAGMEKRVLQFGDVGPGHDEDRSVEVQVLRASAKERVPRHLEVGKDIALGNRVQ